MRRGAVVSACPPAVVVVEVIVRGWTLWLLSLITQIGRRCVFVARLLIGHGRRRAIAWRVHILRRRTHALRCARTRRHAHPTTARTRTRSVVRYAVAPRRRSRAAHVHRWLSRRHRHAPARRSKFVCGVVAWRGITRARRRTPSLVCIVLWWVLSWASTGTVHRRSPTISVSRRRRHRPARRTHSVPTWARPLAA